jgi:hypothetical protein
MTDARRRGAHPGARGDGPQPARGSEAARRPESERGPRSAGHPVAAFFRANPQAFVLLIVCLVLGLGTFLAVLFGLVTAPSDQTTGEPSGAILGAQATLTAAPWPSS